ncbi:hypothetical protein RJT34_28842 [Clitoria ternatea]|uniref:Uncharacterized protein n=1 Tax=Clitoria ternatea TaxID=43366 RepID=A0AAN9FFH5_CLITE
MGFGSAEQTAIASRLPRMFEALTWTIPYRRASDTDIQSRCVTGKLLGYGAYGCGETTLFSSIVLTQWRKSFVTYMLWQKTIDLAMGLLLRMSIRAYAFFLAPPLLSYGEVER